MIISNINLNCIHIFKCNFDYKIPSAKSKIQLLECWQKTLACKIFFFNNKQT